MSGSQSWGQSWRGVPREPAALLRWLLDPLILTIRDSPLLLALTSLLIYVIWGGIAAFGVPYLFWHDTPWMQLAAGTSTALVAWELTFIGYLLASRDDAWCEANPAPGWLVRTAVPLCVILGLAPLGPIRPDSCWEFELGLVLGSLIVLGLRRAVSYALAPERVLDRLVERALPRWISLPRFEHRVQAVYFGLMLVFYLGWTAAAWLRLDPWLPAAVALALALGLLAALYGVVRFNLDRNRVFVYAAAMALFAAVQYLTFGVRHRLAGLDYDQRIELPPSTLASVDEAGLLDQTEALDAWLHARQGAGAAKPKLAVVSVSGGGLRSATWSMTVLTELEQQLDEFPYHVRLLTGASGGMVAAAHWVATLEPPTAAQQHGGRDLVAEVGQNLLDALAVHIALPLPGNRGVALDRALERNSGDALAIGLRELRAREAAGWCPSLVFSPVIVEDGREMLFSNLDVAALTSSNPWLEPDADCPDSSEPERPPCSHSVTGLEFFRLFPDADVRLSTVTRLSASFPYVSPPVQLPTTPTRRLVDAGYTDPFGVDLAARWIAHHRAWLREHTSGVVLIQIRDTADHRRAIGGEPGQTWLERALAGLVAPGEAILSSRRTSTAFRNDSLTATLAALFEDSSRELPFFTTVAFELDAEASLSWALTDAERERIRASLDTDANRQALAWLGFWWRGGREM